MVRRERRDPASPLHFEVSFRVRPTRVLFYIASHSSSYINLLQLKNPRAIFYDYAPVRLKSRFSKVVAQKVRLGRL